MNTQLFTASTAIALAALALAAPMAGAEPSKHQDFRSADAIAASVKQDMSRQSLRGADAQGAPTDAPEVMVVRATRPAPAPAHTSTSLDWADAFIGAGAVLGLTLVGLGRDAAHRPPPPPAPRRVGRARAPAACRGRG